MENINNYIVIKALEDGVVISGISRGTNTRTHHTENLGSGEVFVAQFTEITSAIKVKGKATIYTQYGKIDTE